MNARTIWTIAKKDWIEVRQNPTAWLPMLIVPLIFVIVLPLTMILITSQVPDAQITSDPDMAVFLERMPEFMKSEIAGMNDLQSGIILMLGYMFAPLFLILPLMFSTVIAAESFAGERERKTIEALLYTPASDAELLSGKVLAGSMPAILITWGSFLLYILVVNVASYPLFGYAWFPLATWYPLIFWVSPALALLGIAATVLISARVQTFMGAYQASASLVLLVLAFLAGQMTGILYLSPLVGMIIGLVFWVADAILIWLSVQTFNRSALLASSR